MNSHPPSIDTFLEKLLGFINLSSGAHDAQFFQNLNAVFQYAAERSPSSTAPVYGRVLDLMHDWLDRNAGTNGALKESRQARRVLELCGQHLLPGYLKFHSNVLFHQSDDFLFNSYFVGRTIELILRNEPLQGEAEEKTALLLRRLNDYVGHRPLPTLETHKAEPYPHEWIRPIPVYLSGAGAAFGKYSALIEQAIEILSKTDPSILRLAQFDLEALQELAVDPRALDFDHPVNRRPNHHFGQWDEHSVDNHGVFRRFIVHQITLDAMLQRIEASTTISAQQLLIEGGAVLACTMLMGSGISGRGPGAFDSTMTLSKLVPIVAGYRDQFYNQLIQTLDPAHRERLLAEAIERHQPFGAARQDINNRLSQQRDRQLIHCRLALVYARMGYREAAMAEASIVPVVSARINAQIDCLLSLARRLISKGELAEAAEVLPQISELMLVGIDCGAIVDPWNILGFDGNYSLFPASENSIRDHRIDDLVELVNQIFSAYSELWTSASAANRLDLADRIRFRFHSLVDWWRQYAAHQVLSVDAVDPEDVYNGAEHVAEALNLWHRGGAATGDLEFWSQHAQMFDSPGAYRLVIEALLDRHDFKTSRALMIHWLSQNDVIELQQGDNSFYDLMWRWISAQSEMATAGPEESIEETWDRIKKFFDFLEANADYYWRVPKFEIGTEAEGDQELDLPDNEMATGTFGDEEFEDESDEGDDVLRAAYEEVTYTDETDDGFDGSVYEGGDFLESELESEADRVIDRLEFLCAIAEFWRITATFPIGVDASTASKKNKLPGKKHESLQRRQELYSDWLEQALRYRQQLFELLDTVHEFALPVSGVDSESMLAYDRQRLYKESLTQQIISACVQFENSIRMLGAAILAIESVTSKRKKPRVDERLLDQEPIINIVAAALVLDRQRIVDCFPSLDEYLRSSRLLYVPLSRGGSPQEIVQFRAVQSSIRELLATLPFLGLLTETFELTQMAMTMERNTPIDQGAVTEFDELFRVAYSSMVEAVVRAAKTENPEPTKKKLTRAERDLRQQHIEQLLQSTELLTESMLMTWLNHSRTLRLSVLERVTDRHTWQPLLKFISNYGADLFSQEFLHLSNIRAILHQGVDEWLYKMQRSDLPDRPRLIDEIGDSITLRQAVDYLTLVLEAIIENYPRYRDYNGTTTLSDHGEMLYVLLDFLRLERRYDRISWHLKPVVWAHEILVRNHEPDVAREWRRSLVERVGGEASRYLGQLTRLRKKYSIQMASIGQHLEGRFVKPMLIDRLVAMVPDAVRDPESKECQTVFEMLKFECDTMIQMSPGVGIDIPDWLAALEEEVDKASLSERFQYDPSKPGPLVKPPSLELGQLIEQIEAFPKHQFWVGQPDPEMEEPTDLEE